MASPPPGTGQSVIQLSIDNKAAIDNLRAYTQLVTNWKVANKKIAIQLYGWVIRNYENEGRLVGGWAPIQKATIRRKTKAGYSSKILLQTGVLKNNYGFYSTDQEAGVGNRTPYSIFHETGVPQRGLPQRRQMPAEEDARNEAEAVLGVHLKSAADGAFGR